MADFVGYDDGSGGEDDYEEMLQSYVTRRHVLAGHGSPSRSRSPSPEQQLSHREAQQQWAVHEAWRQWRRRIRRRRPECICADWGDGRGYLGHYAPRVLCARSQATDRIAGGVRTAEPWQLSEAEYGFGALVVRAARGVVGRVAIWNSS